MENRRVITIPIQEIGVVKYKKDLSSEYEALKNLEYETAAELETSGLDEDLSTRVRTTIDKFILYRKEFKTIFKWLQEQVDDYVLNVLGSSRKLMIGSSWGAQMEPGQWTEPHTHISIINGCFYFNLPDNSTPLTLDTYNCLGVREDFKIEIEEKDLVLWDNKISHWVPKNKSKETRYALAFNTVSDNEFEHNLVVANSFQKNHKYEFKNIYNQDGKKTT